MTISANFGVKTDIKGEGYSRQEEALKKFNWIGSEVRKNKCLTRIGGQE